MDLVQRGWKNVFIVNEVVSLKIPIFKRKKNWKALAGSIH